MKARLIFLLTLFVCINSFGQHPKTLSIQEQFQDIYSQVVDNQCKTIFQLQTENEAMKRQLEKMGKEIELYREDVRAKTSEMNSNMALWLAVLTIIMAILGVAIPLILNRRNEKIVEKLLEDTKNEANLAKEQAKKSVEALEKIQPQVDSVKEQVIAATKQALKAEEAAKDAKVSQLLAQALNEEDPSNAIELYTQLIEQYPDTAVAYYNRGCRKGIIHEDLEGQLNDYNKAIELNPNFMEALFNRGNVKIVLDDNAGAISDFDRVIALAPNKGEAYNNRGAAKSMLGDKYGAMADYDKAIKLHSNYLAAYMSRGNLKYGLGDIKGALNDINKALEIVPNYPNALGCRAKCYRKMAEADQDNEKKSAWIAKAEADEMLKSEFDTRAKAQKERIEILNNLQL